MILSPKKHAHKTKILVNKQCKHSEITYLQSLSKTELKHLSKKGCVYANKVKGRSHDRVVVEAVS